MIKRCSKTNKSSKLKLEIKKILAAIENQKLLTLDLVDNELNDLINGRFSMIKSEKIKVGNK